MAYSIPKVAILPPGLDDSIFDTRFKKYKKVLSSSPLSSGTYVLETDSEEEDIFPRRNEEDDIYLQNRLKDFEELNQGIEEILRELGDSGDEGQGLWDISEPELVSTEESEGDTPDVKIVGGAKFKNLTKKRCNNGGGVLSRRLHLDFDARGDSPSRRSTLSSDSGGKSGVPHFGAFSSIRRHDQKKDDERQSRQKLEVGDKKGKTFDKTDATKRTSKPSPQKQSLPTRIKSAMGGFSFAKKKTGEERQRQWVL